MPNVRGFTLVELLVVFAIMAVLISVVPVAYDRARESAQYRDVVRGILSDMRKARQVARLRGRETRFILDLAQHRYGVAGEALRPLPDTIDFRALVAEGEMHNGVAAIRFLPDGGATGGSVQVMRKTGTGVQLRVDWLSGRVTQTALAP
ncbi:general secretion pathway protein H [Acidovorax sp. 107]|uniref:GspH/FimT family pseudopilin n=1 Tax=Acidovorax sp. 107 TaxID=2135638 RepID=UPI000D36762C|nr:GspH/FimT family pseudopilin [Acidovorax sp. 107]PUA98801.1 general secretion pathway protein H [Acidovorax sp. 107]